MFDYYGDVNEALIVEMLNKYGKLPYSLLARLLPNLKEKDLRDRVVELRRHQVLETPIDENGVKWVQLNRLSRVDEDLLKSLWVFTAFAACVDPHNHGPLDYPAKMYFIKEDSVGHIFQYEISVFDCPETTFLRTIDFKKNFKYIIIVPDKDCVENYIEALKNEYKVKSDRFIVACLEHQPDSEIPHVALYSGVDDDE